MTDFSHVQVWTEWIPTHCPNSNGAGEHAAPIMSRLYAVESNFTLTGVMADNRLRIKPSDVQNFVFDLARVIQCRSEPVDMSGTSTLAWR